MEELRERIPQRTPRPPAAAPPSEAPADLAVLAGTASAQAAATPLAPSTVTLTVKTSSASAAQIVATPDTTLGEVMRRVCTDLGVREPTGYVLVARGEVLADHRRTIGEIAGKKLGEVTMRLVRRPEAGDASSSCRF
jgi:hypothetical protein